MVTKYEELSAPFEKIMLRVKESTARPEAIKALEKKLGEIEALMKKWETSMPQITEEERKEVLEGVETARKWIKDNEASQKKKKDHDEPAFLSTDVPKQTLDLEIKIVRLSKRPKPKPPKKKKEEKTENKTDASDDGNAESSTEEGAKSDSGKEGDEKNEENATKVDEDPKVDSESDTAAEGKEKEEL